MIPNYDARFYLVAFTSSSATTQRNAAVLTETTTVDYSDVVGASPVGAAPTTSSFSTWHLASIYITKTTVWRDEENL